MEPIIRIEHLTHTYSAGTPFQRSAVEDVSLDIMPGEFLGIIGHTGSGKSTLIQHLNGLLRPTQGRILLDGKDIWAEPKKIRQVRFQVGLVFQYPEYQLFEETVYKDIAYGPGNMGLDRDEIDRRVRESAALVGLTEDQLEKSPFELSGGQKRRVAIAGVIAMEPKVLILDEPTAGLDPRGREAILAQIRAYHQKRGTTVILVSHSMEEIACNVDRILVLRGSHVYMDGTPRQVFRRASDLEEVGLVRLETSPEDIEGMKAAQGILTVRGGMTSHAAVVARGMGKCCVSGCGAIVMDEENKQFTLAGKTYHEGDWLSLDGSTGSIYDGAMPTVDASVGGDFGRIMAWADKYRRLQVRTNADTPHDAAKARELGAQGIGLCRTEHMFFEGDRIAAIREMICSDTVEQREKALAKLLPMQQGDFEGIYEAMEGCPVTIRFLDPPLHEFVPTEEADIELLAKDMGKTVAEIKAIIASLHEFNPMMGHRGCRLAVTFPEIAVMQTRAVIRAAINVQKRHPEWNMVPEIMIPLVGEVKELKYVKNVVVKTADEELAAAGVEMKYLVGTMIEIPRAALTADEIATEAEFFSFGTNDLTQMTFGFSRDDAGKFLGAYYDKKIYENDPFAKLDQVGVGKLVKMAAKMGRETRPDLHLGICGEHGGDPSSVEFCHKVGLDYVSCSPFRVPIARLAAAQAAIREQRQ